MGSFTFRLFQVVLRKRNLVRKYCSSAGSLMDNNITGEVMDTTTGSADDDTLDPDIWNVEEHIRKSGKDPNSFTREGKVAIYYDRNKKTFYNPTQEVNRDVSILGIQTFIQTEGNNQKDVNILEAMAASGIRSIRYSKEIDNIKEIIANDFSKTAIESLKENCEINETQNVVPNFGDASMLMFEHKHKFFVVDLDPYGSPIPFLESGLQCVSDGGMLLVTATDMAVLAGGNHPEACFSKYGSVSVKSRACQELALRILIHSVQSCAGRSGKYVEPLLSLKIDFYVRIFFRVHHSPILSKNVALNTSMFFQCTGCHMLFFQPLAVKKGPQEYYGSSKGPTVGPHCHFCESSFHIGGPIWTGLIHKKSFVQSMDQNANSAKYEYLGTGRRIQGLLQVVLEEVDDPLLYEISKIASVIKSKPVPLLPFRSALLNLGYTVSASHTGPGLFKTNAPNEVLWEIFLAWRKKTDGVELKEGTLGYNIIKNVGPKCEREISFEIHPDANPPSRQSGALRFQLNPSKYWGPGSRNAFDINRIVKDKTGDVIDDSNDSSCVDSTVTSKRRKR